MTQATVVVEFVIKTARGSYTVSEARLEIANLQRALEDIKEKQAFIEAGKEQVDG